MIIPILTAEDHTEKLVLQEGSDRKPYNEAESSHELGSNSTRRELTGKKYKGPCVATNSIDRCWRCDRNWAVRRKRLADCARGFGERAEGGKNGKIYVVTDSSDNDVVNPKPGTLRHAVIQLKPLWIIFARSMTIKLSQELIMTSHKTIDGRGANVQIAHGAGITIQYIRNVIIHNVRIHHITPSNGGMIRDSVNHVGKRLGTDGDGISIFGSTDIWLDHLSMSRCEDGIIDAIEGSTGITISNSHFTDHDKVMLFGASDNTDVDDKMKITVAYNHFGKRLVQRMPRCRSGFFHLVNNDYTHWEMYAIGGSHHATIISQGNRFIAPPNLPPSKKSLGEITHRSSSSGDWKKWTWVSDGDIFQNGAFFIPSGDLNGAKTFAALELIKAAPAKEVGRITKFSGALKCLVGRPC